MSGLVSGFSAKRTNEGREWAGQLWQLRGHAANQEVAHQLAGAEGPVKEKDEIRPGKLGNLGKADGLIPPVF